MKARFRVRGVLEVTERAPLLLGEVLEGEVQVGMRTPVVRVPDGQERQLSVAAVEVGSEPVPLGPWVGLEFEDCPTADALALLFPPGTAVPLEHPP